MSKWKSSEKRVTHASPTHTHYHYHYHYPISPPHPQQDPQTSHTYEAYRGQQSTKRIRLPEELSFCSQQNEWKRYLDPKVSRMYEEYQLEQSRFSENNARIDKLLQPQEIEVPRRSAVLLHNKERTPPATQKRQLKKLEQLYIQQRELRGSLDQKNRSQITMLTSSENIEAQGRLGQLQKEIQRLRSIEQECIYLRDKFYLHIVGHHGEK